LTAAKPTAAFHSCDDRFPRRSPAPTLERSFAQWRIARVMIELGLGEFEAFEAPTGTVI
jgi:hypothetical protein